MHLGNRSFGSGSQDVQLFVCFLRYIKRIEVKSVTICNHMFKGRWGGLKSISNINYIYVKQGRRGIAHTRNCKHLKID